MALYILQMLTIPVYAGVTGLNPDKQAMNLEKAFTYIEDKDGIFSFDDVTGNDKDGLWKENLTGSSLNFGYTNSVYWIKGNFVNRSKTKESYVFEIAYPVIDDIRIFIIREKVMDAFHMGDKLPFNMRPIKHRDFLFPVNLDPGEKFCLVMRFKTTSSMQLPVNVYRYDILMENSQTEMLGLSFYYGAMLIMILYNLFIFLSIREVMYLYYIFYVSCITLWATSLNGISFQYLWPNATTWNDQVIVFALSGVVFFAAMFASTFLNVKQSHPKHYRVFMVLTSLAGSLMGLTFVIPYRAGISSAMVLAIVTIIYGLVITMVRLRDGFIPSRIFLLAWAMVLFGGVIMALSKFGLLQRNFMTESAVQIGSALEVVLLSFALAHRLNLEKKQRIEAQTTLNIHERHARIAKEHELKNERRAREAQEEAIEIQKKVTETLERNVQERRSKLNESLGKVSEMNSNVMESLAYARMIQTAMLPDPEHIKTWFPDHFIWWAPRDVVGGDFYYVDRIENGYVVVLADCTGHGVPGAFLTLIANWELKRIVRGEAIHDPGEILSRMNRRIKKTLKQEKGTAFSNVGLDMAVCIINPENKYLDFAGARIDLRYIKNHDIHTVKADKESIGYLSQKRDPKYSVHRLILVPHMTFYLSSDGIADQPSETTGQRFGKKQLNDTLFANSDLPLNQQYEHLKKTLATHQGKRDQVDDMTMVAFEVML